MLRGDASCSVRGRRLADRAATSSRSSPSESARSGPQVALLGVVTNDIATEARSFLVAPHRQLPELSELLNPACPFDGARSIADNDLDQSHWPGHLGMHIVHYATVAALQNDAEHDALGVSVGVGG
jgi:hypothetical protein